MGLSPRDVRDLTLWQYRACLRGYNKAHTPSEPGKISSKAEEDRLWNLIKDDPSGAD
jgi:hypothetical protein